MCLVLCALHPCALPTVRPKFPAAPGRGDSSESRRCRPPLLPSDADLSARGPRRESRFQGVAVRHRNIKLVPSAQEGDSSKAENAPPPLNRVGAPGRGRMKVQEDGGARYKLDPGPTSGGASNAATAMSTALQPSLAHSAMSVNSVAQLENLRAAPGAGGGGGRNSARHVGAGQRAPGGALAQQGRAHATRIPRLLKVDIPNKPVLSGNGRRLSSARG